MTSLCPPVHKGGDSGEKGEEKYEGKRRRAQIYLGMVPYYYYLLLRTPHKYDSKQQPSPYNM